MIDTIEELKTVLLNYASKQPAYVSEKLANEYMLNNETFFHYGDLYTIDFLPTTLKNVFKACLKKVIFEKRAGEKFIIFKDESAWCATTEHFTNIQESECAFGDTPIKALEAFINLRNEQNVI